MTYLLLQTFLLLLSAYFFGAFVACLVKRTLMATQALQPRAAAVPVKAAQPAPVRAARPVPVVLKPRKYEPIQPRIDILPRPEPRPAPAALDTERWERTLAYAQLPDTTPRKPIIEIRPMSLPPVTARGPGADKQINAKPAVQPATPPKPVSSPQAAAPPVAPTPSAPTPAVSKAPPAAPVPPSPVLAASQPRIVPVPPPAPAGAPPSAGSVLPVASKPVAAPAPAPTPAAQPKPAAVTAPPPPQNPPSTGTEATAQPTVAAGADDFLRIRAIDEVIAGKLHGLGVKSFEDIARWSPSDVTRLDQVLGLSGRVDREQWVEQAQILAKGGETYYSRNRAAALAQQAKATSAAVPTQLSASGPSPTPVPVQPPAAQPSATPQIDAPPAGATPVAVTPATPPSPNPAPASTPAPPAAPTPPAPVADAPARPVSTPPPTLPRLEPMPPRPLEERVAGGPVPAMASAAAAAAAAASALTGRGGPPAAPSTSASPSPVSTPSPSPVSPPPAAPPVVAQPATAPPAGGPPPLAAQPNPTTAAPPQATAQQSLANQQPASAPTASAALSQRTPAEMAAAAAAAFAAASASVTRGIRPIEPLSPLSKVDPRISRPARLVDAIKEQEGKEPGRPAPKPSGEFDGLLSGKAPAASDDLKRIRGVGVLIEKRLNALGVWTYEQIARWTASDVEKVSEQLDFKGRIERENWIEQARILASGGQTEFSRRVDKGEVDSSKA